MLLKKWEDLPDFMKNDEVKVYYDILNKKRFSLILKRIFDIVMSMLMIILVSPIIIILSILIKIDSRGPIFYKQERITQYGKEFHILKFRTMVVEADKVGSLITEKNDKRITRMGMKIRKCRLDELPQLINVLIGDMSFVGTRPEVKKYVMEYSHKMKATLLLPAGITSLASIEYRDEDGILEALLQKGKTVEDIYIQDILPDKMEYNLNYIENYRFVKDIQICFYTVIRV
ncbi:MAG: sugar transferase [Bacilli bacterium]